MKKEILIIVAACVFMVASCETNSNKSQSAKKKFSKENIIEKKSINEKLPSEKIDLGVLKNKTYKNDFFGFEITAPANWFALTDGFNLKTQDEIKEYLAGSDQEMKKLVDRDLVTNLNFVTFYKNNPNEYLGFNPNIIVGARNLKDEPYIKTIQDDLKQTISFLKQSNINESGIEIISLNDEFREYYFGKKKFYVLDASFNFKGTIINQEVFSTIHDGFSFSMILSYDEDLSKKELYNILNSVVYDEK